MIFGSLTARFGHGSRVGTSRPSLVYTEFRGSPTQPTFLLRDRGPHLGWMLRGISGSSGAEGRRASTIFGDLMVPIGLGWLARLILISVQPTGPWGSRPPDITP